MGSDMRAEGATTLGLSAAQTEIWQHEQAAAQRSPSIRGALRFSGSLDRERLQQCLDALVERYPALRTTISTAQGQPLQQIWPGLRLNLELVNTRFVAAAEREDTVRRWARAESQRPFDVSEGPLVRTILLQFTDDEHVLLWCAHPLVLDRPSLERVLHELVDLYGGQPLEPPADQRPPAAAPAAGTLAPVLSPELARLQLPYDQQLQPGQPGRRAGVPVSLSALQAAALRAYAEREGTDLSTLVLSALYLLLARYTGQQELSLHVLLPGSTGYQRVGVLSALLPVPLDLADNPPFRVLLQRVRQALEQAEQLLSVPSGPAPLTPGAQIVFEPAPLRSRRRSLPGLQIALQHIWPEQTSHDLWVALEQVDQGVAGTIAYNADLFEAATVERLAGQLQTLLLDAVTQPNEPVAALRLLSAAEEQRLLVEWNATHAPYPEQLCLHQLFEAQCRRQPDAVAVRFESEELSYAELDRRANQLAHYLQQLGVGSESRVGLCLERSPAVAVGILGILKAGAAYVPLDPSYPLPRLTFMLQDAGLKLLITQQSLLQELPAAEVQSICLDSAPAIADQPATALDVGCHPDQLAYVLYTSGSTGTPKAVCCPHRGVVNLLADVERRQPLQPGDRCALWTNLSFDVSVYELFSAWMAGGALDIAPDEVRAEAAAFIDWLASRAIQSAYIPPFMVRPLADWLQGPGRRLPLRRLLVGVEPIPEHLLVSIADAVPGLQIINGYGPTEASICATLYSIGPRNVGERTTPIGRPVQNMQLYLLDQALRPVPVGVPGEVYIGGVGLARGYLNREQLTRERFIAHPFDSAGGARLYRTGDLARYLPDGNLQFLGRVDQQVKLRGYRIEIGELESALKQCPGVAEAVVLAREDRPGVKQLVAYVVLQDAPQAPAQSVQQLRAFLAQRLPAYMLPAAFVVLDAIPVTPNGKTDRAALPAPAAYQDERSTEGSGPRTPEERQLAEIWAQAFDLPSVGIADNFFALGGDSLLASQILAQAARAGLQLTLQQLFKHPTIGELAALLTRAPSAQDGPQAARRLAPLSPIQHWMLEQSAPEPPCFNQVLLLELQQPVQQAPLAQAWEHVCRHHDMLRVAWVQRAGRWQQLPGDATIPLAVIDASQLPVDELGQRVEQICADLTSAFSPFSGPRLRGALIERGTGAPQQLLLVANNLGLDHFSWRIVLEDLQTAYQQLSGGQPVQLPPVNLHFPEWVWQLHERAQSTAVRGELHYWLSQGQPGDAAAAPATPPPAGAAAGQQRTLRVLLDAAHTSALQERVSKTFRLPVADLILALLAQAYARWSGRPLLRALITRQGLEGMLDALDFSRSVGSFILHYPLTLAVPPAASPGEAVRVVKQALQRLPRRGLGYALLRYLCEDSAIVERLQALPTPTLHFTYLGRIEQLLPPLFRNSGAGYGSLRQQLPANAAPLYVEAWMRAGQLSLDWTFNPQLYPHSRMVELANSTLELLRGLVQHEPSADEPVWTPGDFPLAGLDERELQKLTGALHRSKQNEG